MCPCVADEDDVIVTKEVSAAVSVDDVLSSSPVVTIADVTQSSSTGAFTHSYWRSALAFCYAFVVLFYCIVVVLAIV